MAATLDGRRCRTKRALLDEVARVLDFPAYFGRTWDALEDCLTDLAGGRASGYRLVITAADRLLARNPAHYATFVALLEDVGRAWATAATGHPGRGAGRLPHGPGRPAGSARRARGLGRGPPRRLTPAAGAGRARRRRVAAATSA